MKDVSFSQSMMFRKSWDFMKKQGVTMVGLYLAFMVVSVFLSLISGENVTSGRYILGNLLAAILSWGFGMGFGKLILNILDGMEPKMSVFLSIWSRAWTYLKLEILILSVIVVFGLIAFIVADFAVKVPFAISGFIPLLGYLILAVLIILLCWIMIRISFAGMIILDTELGCRAAVKRSWQITKGYVWQLVLLYLLILLLNILGLLALIVGVFFTIVMSLFISTIAYRVLWALYRENENIMDEVSPVNHNNEESDE
ncbi:hypothetical protein [uncultured Coprobacter sp.]|jgi:membrane protein|uniref:hypothetical protein n=1 Tax=uncultured Coprobacter sp. TaxID=1720550 RepID=UPI0025E9E18E|nr:hypothetical protein [uncultured Coprobacter sp.]